MKKTMMERIVTKMRMMMSSVDAVDDVDDEDQQ